MAEAERTFEGGATRDLDAGKYDYEGFLSPLAMEAFGAYMNACRMTPTGLRDSDNWQKGIPLTAYMKSNWRHFFDLWRAHRSPPGGPTDIDAVIACMAVLFNTQGYLHEKLKANPALLPAALNVFEKRRAREIEERRAREIEGRRGKVNDRDGWVAFTPDFVGSRPVPGETQVQVKFSNEAYKHGMNDWSAAEHWDWSNKNGEFNIVKYRVKP